ncbi:hypothetical protein HZB60_03935, partial [candidate division KSB1 bacterium]|nr:hypothetical protein [candidate division KSB1 bacterium]
MKKALIFCTMLVAMCCSLALADVDNINKATAVNGPSMGTSNGAVAGEDFLAKQAYERMLQGLTITPAEKDLISRYFPGSRESGGSLDNVGGPDGFGYRWIDNNADSVVYGWIELCSDPTASLIMAGGDDIATSIPLGETFPYYGTNYTTAWASSNGMLSLNASNSGYSNSCISATNTNSALYVYWDDMLETAGVAPGTCTNGVIYYKNFGDYTVVEWHWFDPFSGTGITSVEAILWGSTSAKPGMIKYQWHATEYTHTSVSATVGIEAPMADGLQYICNLVGIVGGRAVVFYPPVSAARGRCCYIPVGGDPCHPTCEEGVFQTYCNGLGGSFLADGNCTANACPTPLAGDLICNAIPYTGGCVDGNNSAYTDNYNAVCPYTSSGKDVVYSYTGTGIPTTFSLCQGLTNYDTKLYILASDGVTVVACSDDACANPPIYSASYISRIECLTLAAGSLYYIVVDAYSAGDFGDYTLCAAECQACPQECPVGGRPEGEACPNIPDLYNTGCNDASGNFVFSQIGCPDVVCGTYEDGTADPGLRDTDWYLLTVAARESLTVSVVGESATALFLLQAPCPGTTLASIGVAACSTATLRRCLDPGDYIIVVVPTINPTPCLRYTLTTSCEPCAPEAVCDFPNLDLEPNDTCTLGQPVQCGGFYCGAVSPSGDDDYYSIVIPEGTCGILHIDVFANATPGYFPYGGGLDSWVYLWAADCATQVGFDDDGGIGFDSHLDSQCLPAGTYFIDVGGYGDGSTGPYVLAVSCEQCVCPCFPTPEVVFHADNDNVGSYPAYWCADLCAGAPTLIVVCSVDGHPLDPAKTPIVTVSSGCSPLATRCDRVCDAGAADWMGALPYSLWYYNTLTGCFEFTLTGVANGCVCVCLEGFLAAELGDISALAGDNSVRVDWN